MDAGQISSTCHPADAANAAGRTSHSLSLPCSTTDARSSSNSTVSAVANLAPASEPTAIVNAPHDTTVNTVPASKPAAPADAVTGLRTSSTMPVVAAVSAALTSEFPAVATLTASLTPTKAVIAVGAIPAAVDAATSPGLCQPSSPATAAGHTSRVVYGVPSSYGSLNALFPPHTQANATSSGSSVPVDSATVTFVTS